MNGSYQFEHLENRHTEAAFLAERACLRLDDFPKLLRRHGLPSQGRVLEVGCGQGLRSSLIAKQSPALSVIGVDRSPELLASTQEHLNENANLSFALADLYELPFADGTFDFVYARLVFMHLNDPLKALKELKRVLTPGGRILIEDADRDCMFFEPAPASFKSYWQKIQEGQRQLGGDPNVGRKLAPYLRTLGFCNMTIEPQTLLGTGRDIEFLARTLLPSLNSYLSPHDQREGARALQDLHELAQQPEATFYHFWFVVSGELPLPINEQGF